MLRKDALPKEQLNWSSALLDEAGIRVTRHRCTILCLLSQAEHPLSVRELCSRFGLDAHYVTVYRSVNQMNQAGLLHRVDFGGGIYRYELRSHSGTHQHHLMCSDCGGTVRLQERVVEQMLTRYPDRTRGFHVNDYTLVFYGVCPDCLKNRCHHVT